MYNQKDPQWRDKKLGNSELSMNWWGCVVTAVAESLRLAGYDVYPGQVCDSLNANGGFTADGLIIWSKVEEAYPQFHFGGAGYFFKKGVLGRHNHWLLEYNGTLYDPLTGGEGAPAGWYEVKGSREASIDQAPAPEQPETSPEPQGAGARTYMVQEGDSLSKIAQQELGDGNRWPEIYEMNKDTIVDPDFIYPEQEIKLPN
jgi:hypothetical protein